MRASEEDPTMNHEDHARRLQAQACAWHRSTHAFYADPRITELRIVLIVDKQVPEQLVRGPSALLLPC